MSMEQNGLNLNTATVTTKFVADFTEARRAYQEFAEQVEKMPERFRDSLKRVADEFSATIDGLSRKIDALGGGVRDAAAAPAQAAESARRPDDALGDENLRVLRDVSDSVRDLNTSMATVIGLLTAMQSS